jgi:dihydroorotate dehydrogenase electron transfer subunit
VTHPSHRDTILSEDALITQIERYPAEQFVVRLHAPRIAAMATPGSFIHLSCDASLPMRRPLSIMRASATDGWMDVLYKVIGKGTRTLAGQAVGQRLSALGPIGNGFDLPDARTQALLIGGGVGIPPMVFLAEAMVAQDHTPALAIMGSEVPFPFEVGTARTSMSGVETGVNATMTSLDRLGVPSRLASAAGFAGCHRGYVTDLADQWLRALDAQTRANVVIYACGPNPMLAATATLARHHNVNCFVSMEEFMACAVGGCAGCAIRTSEPDGPAMKRVCVDGPVFDARNVDWEALPH